MKDGIIRRGPVGRPGPIRQECTFQELADIILSLGALTPEHGPKKARRLGGYVVERADKMPDLFALPEHGLTLRAWLIVVLQRMTQLTPGQHKAQTFAKPVPTLTLQDELTVPYPDADHAIFEWGDNRIEFRPRDAMCRPKPPPLRPISSVVISIGLLLALTPSVTQDDAP